MMHGNDINPEVEKEAKRLMEDGILSPKQIQTNLNEFVRKTFDPIPSRSDKSVYLTYDAVSGLKRKYLTNKRNPRVVIKQEIDEVLLF